MDESGEPLDQDADEPGLVGALRMAFGGRRKSAAMKSPSLRAGLLEAGTDVAQFRVLELIGRGGMGELFLAHDRKLDRRVALKAIRSGVRTDPEARRRFEREAKVLGKLDHPGICRIFDYVDAGDADFLVLEYIDGEPLSKVLDRPLTQATALDHALQIADALAAAHAKGVIHRDLKPSNLMLTSGGRIKILDFGIARALSVSGLRDEIEAQSDAAPPTPAGLTQVGAVMGTLDYMSPEQARGEAVSGTADVYALGLLLQEMWSGSKARPRGLQPLELLRFIEAEGRLPASGLRSDLRQLVDQMCAPEPATRLNAFAAAERLRHVAGRGRRRARIGVAAAAALVTAVGGIKYTLDLREAHAATVANQDRADRLIRFMHDELWTRVGEIGQLGILEDVWEESTKYFESIPAEDLSDEQLADRSRAFYQIGTVWRDKRDERSDRAERAFEASLELAEELARRDPDNLDRKFAVSQAEFYLGDLSLYRLDHPTAAKWLERYHETSMELAAAAPDNEDYAMELAWSEHNLGALYLEQGRPDAARQIFRKSAATWEGFIERYPDDPSWIEELAPALSWLGRSSLAVGELKDAHEALSESATLWRKLASSDSERRDWHHEWIVVTIQLAAVESIMGQAASAAARLQEARVEVDALCQWDRSNGEWARTRAFCLLNLGTALLNMDQVEEAGERLKESLASLEELRDDDASDPDLDLQCAGVRTTLAEWYWLTAKAPVASEEAQAAIELLTRIPARKSSESSSPLRAGWLARAHLLLPRSSDSGSDDVDPGAEAFAALRPFSESSRDPRLLMTLARTCVRQGRDVRAAEIVDELKEAGVNSPTWTRLMEAAPYSTFKSGVK